MNFSNDSLVQLLLRLKKGFHRNQEQKAGSYKVTFNASGFASGIYFYKLSAGTGFVQTKKMILLR